MGTEERRLLMVFAKNIMPGHVKTRLARRTGKDKAVQIYRILLQYTRNITLETDVDRQIWYDRFEPDAPIFSRDHFLPRIQYGKGLGERMKFAFQQAFKEGYQRAVIIGTDCAELTSKTISEAFDMLQDREVVLGPAEDGGYYLLGMKAFYPILFENISWGTNRVFAQTTRHLKEKGIDYGRLEQLRDVDHWSDWIQIREKIKRVLTNKDA